MSSLLKPDRHSYVSIHIQIQFKEGRILFTFSFQSSHHSLPETCIFRFIVSVPIYTRCWRERDRRIQRAEALEFYVSITA
jgi:hypothetical protein